MSGDARALPLRDTPVGGPAAARRRRLRGWRAGALIGASRAQWLGAICLLAIVAGSLLVVVMAADRPSILSPTTHASFFPRWMAGPLGGAWPGLTRDTTALRWLLSGAIVAMFITYLLALRYAATLPARGVIAAVVLVHALFLLAPPMALTDVFNYINYGRMEVVHHLNPYTTIPILEPHSDPSYSVSNWHQLLSPYGPLFTLLSFAVVPLGVAASFWALKVILVAASLATIALVWRCARLLGRDPVMAIVLVGLNPIVLVWGLGGDHNDSLMLLLIVLGFFLLLHSRSDDAPSRGGPAAWLRPLSPAAVAAGCAFVAAAAIKASAAVLIPVVLAGLLRSRRRLAQVLLGMVLAGVAVGIASLIAFGLHVPDLSTQSRLVTNESVPNLIGLAIGAGGETEALRVLLSGVLAVSVLACCVYAWRREESLSAAGWASVALLVTLSWVLPWYVLWVLPLAALSASRWLRGAALVLGVYLIIAWAPAAGQLWDAVGFHPERTSLGRLHQRYVREL
ncbi:MAG TPA: glycosyltransferase 87 family protein, partial [Chloroflexota bacterium]|nr:glycosyltransferase 87 family protein [Chloroflexota bacterium]